MERDVFISYSYEDKTIADAVCANLESNGIRCWIAPRDIFPGSDWAQSIIDAIKSSKLMVLIFSKNANGSNQVTKELNLAVSHNLVVVPFKVDDSVPSGSMEYFLADMHWLDSIDGDMQSQINKLIEVVKSVLQLKFQAEPSTPPMTENKTNTASAVPSFQYTNPNAPKPQTPPMTPQPTSIPGPHLTKKVGFFEAYGNMWKNFFKFKGGASRSEYWKPVILNVIIQIIILFAFGGLFTIVTYGMEDFVSTLWVLFIFVTSLPFISLSVRRLHDAGYSGWWMLLCLLGWASIVPIIFFCMPTNVANNKYTRK